MSCCFYKGDVFQNLKRIPDKSIHLLYINPPFGTTQNYWDEKLDWPKLFQEYFRVLRPEGMLVIHCSIPFNYELIRAAPKPPSYSWYWKKESYTAPLLSRVQPRRQVEEILVWKNKTNTYYPQPVGTEVRPTTYMTKNDYYGPTTKTASGTRIGKTRSHLLEMRRNIDGYATRPDEMVELIISSYTKPGDTILDTFCYKGLTGVIAKRMNRKWIGIDKYFFPDKIIQPPVECPTPSSPTQEVTTKSSTETPEKSKPSTQQKPKQKPKSDS